MTSLELVPLGLGRSNLLVCVAFQVLVHVVEIGLDAQPVVVVDEALDQIFLVRLAHLLTVCHLLLRADQGWVDEEVGVDREVERLYRCAEPDDRLTLVHTQDVDERDEQTNAGSNRCEGDNQATNVLARVRTGSHALSLPFGTFDAGSCQTSRGVD